MIQQFNLDHAMCSIFCYRLEKEVCPNCLILADNQFRQRRKAPNSLIWDLGRDNGRGRQKKQKKKAKEKKRQVRVCKSKCTLQEEIKMLGKQLGKQLGLQKGYLYHCRCVNFVYQSKFNQLRRCSSSSSCSKQEACLTSLLPLFHFITNTPF